MPFQSIFWNLGYFFWYEIESGRVALASRLISYANDEPSSAAGSFPPTRALQKNNTFTPAEGTAVSSYLRLMTINHPTEPRN